MSYTCCMRSLAVLYKWYYFVTPAAATANAHSMVMNETLHREGTAGDSVRTAASIVRHCANFSQVESSTTVTVDEACCAASSSSHSDACQLSCLISCLEATGVVLNFLSVERENDRSWQETFWHMDLLANSHTPVPSISNSV